MEKLYKINDDVSSGVKIHKASDDPFGTGLSLRYEQQIDQTKQWIENADSSREWIAHTTEVLGEVQNITQQIYAKSIQGDNDTVTQKEKDTLALLINEQLEQILDLANNSYNGKSVFNGDVINVSPFYAVKEDGKDISDIAVFTGFVDGSPNNPEYVYYKEQDDGSFTGIYLNSKGETTKEIPNDVSYGNTSIEGQMSRRISSSEIINIAVSGTDAFMPNGPKGDGDLFQSIIKVRDGLRSGDSDMSGGEIDDLVDAMENVTAWQARSGTIYTRLDLAKGVLETDEIDLTDALSRVKDTDVAEAMMDYNKYEAAYTMALNIGARIMQTSLIDYM